MEPNQKIEFGQIRDIFNLKNQKNLEFYIENIFPDLSTYEKGSNKGVSKVKFVDFMKIPVFICDKLFTIMDKNKDGFLSLDELVSPLCKLYFGDFEETAEIIFQIYDFDNDGVVNVADIKMILSFLPLKTDKTKTEYKYQLESLSELDETLKQTFKTLSSIKFKDFLSAIQIKSDIYLQLLCYFYQRCPFQEKTVSVISKSSSSSIKGLYKVNATSADSPRNTPPTSKKSSSNIILNSPSHKTRFSSAEEFLSKASPKGDAKDSDEEDKKAKPKRKFDSFSNLDSVEMSGMKGMIRHTGASNKKLNEITNKSSFNSPTNFLKKAKKDETCPEVDLSSKYDKGKESDEEDEKVASTTQVIVEPDEDSKEQNHVLYEGQICKYSKKSKAVVSLFMSIIGEDIYYYTDQSKSDLKHIHNLSGCFIKENGSEKIDKVEYYSFSVIFSNKIRTFLHKDRAIAKEWTKNLRNAIGYKNFFDFYEMLDDLGEGQFGLVKLGVHIKTQEKVAIKIIKKSKMKPQEAGLIKNEIDVLKVCRHPNIVQFLDHFENSEYIFIVMEYIKYGHLREYLTKKKFLISEKRASKIAYQIANALNYLHSFGIIHRDLKPDNIMVADSGANFQVKLMDFGLSKIIGPKERAVEGYGTLCFVAPEIIMREPYNNSVDIWSLGVMMYYILSAELPFDDLENSEKTIAKKIVYEDHKYPEIKWKSKSKEIKDFINLCLIKDAKKRVTIDKLKEHVWFKTMEKVEDK